MNVVRTQTGVSNWSFFGQNCPPDVSDITTDKRLPCKSCNYLQSCFHEPVNRVIAVLFILVQEKKKGLLSLWCFQILASFSFEPGRNLANNFGRVKKVFALKN